MTRCQVSPHARVGTNVKIGDFTVVHANVVLGDDVSIGEHCVLGTAGAAPDSAALVIGAGAVVRSHAVIYGGSRFGPGLSTGHHVLIREQTRAGRGFRLGSFSDIEGDVELGDFVSMHGYVHVGRGSRIGHFVWLYSQVTLTNDPLPPSFLERPVTLDDGVVVCVGCTVMPGAHMEIGSYAAAATLVQGRVPAGAVVAGRDGAVVGHVSRLLDLETMTRHPWMRHYSSRYPEEAHARLGALCESIVTSRAQRESAS